MTATGARYDPRTGTLVAPAADLRALVAGDLTRPLLRTTGAVRDGVVDRRLAPTLDALRHPSRGTLQLSYGGRAMDGWRGAEVVALLPPADTTGHHTLVGIVPARLPAALAKAAAVTERPRAPAPVPADVLRDAPDVVRWWRLVHGPAGGSAGGLLEVVDTTQGLFLVQDDERAIPTDASAVRHLVRWLVAGGEVLAPLRRLPSHAALPVAAG